MPETKEKSTFDKLLEILSFSKVNETLKQASGKESPPASAAPTPADWQAAKKRADDYVMQMKAAKEVQSKVAPPSALQELSTPRKKKILSIGRVTQPRSK